MISTVTTSTVSVVTLAGSFAIIGILVLLALLVQKELASAAEGERVRRMGVLSNIGVVPLLVAFALIVISKVVEVLK